MGFEIEKTSFDCIECGRTVYIPENDWGHYQLKGFYCPDCNSVIALKRYKVNIPGAKTVFYFIGQALGDIVVFDAVRKAYIEDNPDENVIFMDSEWPIPKGIDKLFVSDLRIKSSLFTLSPLAYEYIMINEVQNLRKRNIFPEWYNFKKPAIELPDKYVVVQLRNIEKADFKNVIPAEGILLFEKLNKYGIPIVLVGNDKPIGFEQNYFEIYDYRNKLTLDEIAWLCRKAFFTVCKDSGLGHLAGAAGGSVISWNFVNKKWIPHTSKKSWFFMSDINEYMNFLEAVESMAGEF